MTTDTKKCRPRWSWPDKPLSEPTPNNTRKKISMFKSFDFFPFIYTMRCIVCCFAVVLHYHYIVTSWILMSPLRTTPCGQQYATRIRGCCFFVMELLTMMIFVKWIDRSHLRWVFVLWKSVEFFRGEVRCFAVCFSSGGCCERAEFVLIPRWIFGIFMVNF